MQHPNYDKSVVVGGCKFLVSFVPGYYRYLTVMAFECLVHGEVGLGRLAWGGRNRGVQLDDLEETLTAANCDPAFVLVSGEGADDVGFGGQCHLFA